MIINKDCEQCAQAQCILWYATRPSKSTWSLLCLVTCLLLYASFQFSFVCDAVVHRTLVLIAFLVAIFHVAIFHVGFAVLEEKCSQG